MGLSPRRRPEPGHRGGCLIHTQSATYLLQRLHDAVFAALSPTNGNLNESRLVPGVPNTIGRIAFGRYVSPDFRVHPGEYIPPVASRTGEPVPTGGENEM